MTTESHPFCCYLFLHFCWGNSFMFDIHIGHSELIAICHLGTLVMNITEDYGKILWHFWFAHQLRWDWSLQYALPAPFSHMLHLDAHMLMCSGWEVGQLSQTELISLSFSGTSFGCEVNLTWIRESHLNRIVPRIYKGLQWNLHLFLVSKRITTPPSSMLSAHILVSLENYKLSN